MSEIERTPAGLQIVIPGCERRTLPKSTTPVDESGQGLLLFYKSPTLRGGGFLVLSRVATAQP
jgi:hypothetical protein